MCHMTEYAAAQTRNPRCCEVSTPRCAQSSLQSCRAKRWERQQGEFVQGLRSPTLGLASHTSPTFKRRHVQVACYPHESKDAANLSARSSASLDHRP